MMAVLQEPVDDIQVICLKLRRLIFDALDRMQDEIDAWEPAPYEHEPERRHEHRVVLVENRRNWFR